MQLYLCKAQWDKFILSENQVTMFSFYVEIYWTWCISNLENLHRILPFKNSYLVNPVKVLSRYSLRQNKSWDTHVLWVYFISASDLSALL